MFKNGLYIGLPQVAWVKKTVDKVETLILQERKSSGWNGQ